jgi:hypothetical protein
MKSTFLKTMRRSCFWLQVGGIVDALNADKGEDLGDDAWKELLTGPNVKALTIGTGLVFFQQVRPASRSEEYDERTEMASMVVKSSSQIGGESAKA